MSANVQFGSTHPRPSLSRLQPGKGPSSDKEIKKAAQDFESLFLHQLLQEMRQTNHESWDITGGGFGSQMVRDLCDGELANQMAKGKGIGIADVITKQLSGPANKLIQKSGRSD